MILVTVGTTIHQFNRLIEEIDRLAKAKKFKDVVIQIGVSDYKPKHCQYHEFIEMEKMEELNKKADVIVSHAGSGCILMALKYKKPLVLVPRLKKFGEHESDHQLQIVKSLEEQGKVVGVYDIKNLENAIKESVKLKSSHKTHDSKVIKFIKNFIHENANKKTKICAIANAGGHFTQLMPLLPELKKYDTFFVTTESTHLKKTLKNQRYYWIANPKFNLLSSLWTTLKLLIKERPRIIVTSGAGCTVAMSILSKIFLNSKIIFIECFSRSLEPSLTGKILYHFSDLFFVQWETLLEHYGEKARFDGLIYSY